MKFFSVEGAMQLIPQLEGDIQRLRELQGNILRKKIEMDILRMTGGVSDSTAYAPSQNLGRGVKEMNHWVLEFNSIIGKMNGLGCQLKDPEAGLVDFFHIRDDKIVNLCWKFGEDKIQFWHELEGGFATRENL